MASGKRKKNKIQAAKLEEPEQSIEGTSGDSRSKPSRKRRIKMVLLLIVAGLLIVSAIIYFVWGAYINYVITAKTGVQAYNKGMYNQAEYLLQDALQIALAQYEKERSTGGEESARELWEKYQITATANKLGLTLLAVDKQIPIQKIYINLIVPPLLRMYGEKSPRLIASYDILARSMVKQKDFSRAEMLYREMVDILTKAYGPNDGRLAEALNQYAVMLDQAGRKEDAQKINIEARRLRALQ